MKNNRGMALVVALLTSFILLALVASLFWIIASTSRQVEYAKNSAIALNLAEAGTADAIYRLNYCGTDGVGTYPFALSVNPFGTSILVSLPIDILRDPPYAGLVVGPGTNAGISGTLNNGNYYVGLINDTAGPDTIIAVGVYKGVRRILTVSLRGNNFVGIPRQEPIASPQGISEAFNKHVIYAYTVTRGATGTIVTGNIACVTPPSITSAGTTVTQLNSSLFSAPTPIASLPPGINSTPDRTFVDGFETVSPLRAFNIANFPPYASDYDGPSKTYTFVTGSEITETLELNTNTGTPTIQLNGNIILANKGIKTTGATGIITTTGALIFQSSAYLQAPTVNINNGSSITGTLIINSSSPSTITFSGTTSIDASGSTAKAGLIIMGSPSSNTLTFSASTPTITLGANQDVAVAVYSSVSPFSFALSGSGSFSLGGSTPSSKKALIAYSTGGTANVNINGTFDGLLYAGGTTSGNIEVNSPAFITGILVASGISTPGTVTLTGGDLHYTTATSSIFTNAVSANDIYQGFFGGRRAYVPTWQGWRLR